MGTYADELVTEEMLAKAAYAIASLKDRNMFPTDNAMAIAALRAVAPMIAARAASADRLDLLEGLLRQAHGHVPIVEANKDFQLHKDITAALESSQR